MQGHGGHQKVAEGGYRGQDYCTSVMKSLNINAALNTVLEVKSINQTNISYSSCIKSLSGFYLAA